MTQILTTKNCILFLFFTLVSTALFSQGLERSALTTNQVLVKKWGELKMKPELRASSIHDTISLDTIRGILDDFSYPGPYPDTALWLDNQVFVNRGFAKAPVTIGVATFDGLNANGYPYNFLASQTASLPADSLTSKPINLLNYLHNGTTVNYQISDSLYFSFYYQPQGLGNAPEINDSLVLEFKAPGSPVWTHIWAQPGKALDLTDSSWTLVMIPLKDIQYLQKGFQFRFRNYATLTGGFDHWHIDYVYLNKYRTRADTIFEDVAFEYDTPSLLNTYYTMPWKHYNSSFMKTVYSTSMRNNFSGQKNGSFIYKIYDQTGAQVNTTYTGGSDNLFPYVPNGPVIYPPFTSPPINFTIPPLTDTSSYTIECSVYSSPDKHRANDTVRHVQKFYNYYSYDDGSAETAFDVAGALNAQMAEKFVSTIADTLRCIDIYFNPMGTNANLYVFSLNVWKDAGGVPGTAIYTSDSVMSPTYAQTGEDQFTHYYLKTPLYLNAGAFYIGFTQKTDQPLDVGVDRNNNTQNKIFYNVSGSWNNPVGANFAGSLMMHPVFGAADFTTGINQHTAVDKNSFMVYPNPANAKLYIKSNSPDRVAFSIIDLFGRTILENKLNVPEYIDISSLAEGVYFIRLIDGSQVSTLKFIKVN